MGFEEKTWDEFSGSPAIALLITKVCDMDLKETKNAWCTINIGSLPSPSW